MIRLNQVSKQYHSGEKPAVLDNVSLTIEQHRFVCLLGPSGCGKTTLLNLIAGFVTPTSGQVLVSGKPVQGPGPDRGVVFQDSTLFPWMTVGDNIRFGLRQQGLDREQQEQIVREYLALVGLSAHADTWPVRLSGGMRQRAAIARVLALHPSVMLMDEPFSALDANSRERLQDELLRICTERPVTVLYITHTVEEAAFLAERVIVMGPAPRFIHADIPLPSIRPRERTSAEFADITALLRAELNALPCCIAPS